MPSVATPMKRPSSAAESVSKRPRVRAETPGKSQGSVTPRKVSLTISGQHKPTSGLCISTTLDGKPCQGTLPKPDGVPYCASCRKTGDPSLRVMQHPNFGKILVAARDLPKTYHMAWWGSRTTKKAMPDAHWEWALDTAWGMIDARPHQGGSLLQFCACPGPSELTTVWMGPDSGKLAQKKEPLNCMLFSTRMPVPQNHQLTMMYNESVSTTDEFFKERGLVRSDVGTPKYPCLKKQNAA